MKRAESLIHCADFGDDNIMTMTRMTKLMKLMTTMTIIRMALIMMKTLTMMTMLRTVSDTCRVNLITR